MSTASKFQAGYAKIETKFAEPIRIRTFTKSYGSVWDDDLTLTSGVDVWTSGIPLPLKTREGSTDAVLVQQGKLIDSDLKLYLSGGIAFAGSEDIIKIGIGSPIRDEYAPIPLGARAVPVQGTYIYKKAYIRRLTTGSLIGE